MVEIIGHGLLSEYCGKFHVQETTTIQNLIDQLSIPAELVDILIPVRESLVLSINDKVNDNDVIHLYTALLGG